MREPIRLAVITLVFCTLLYVFYLYVSDKRVGVDPDEAGLMADGMLHLDNWDGNRLIKLDGAWEFYWGQLLTTSQLGQTPPDAVVPVPNVWNRYRLTGREQERLPAFGYATYRLRVEGAPPNRMLAMKFLTASTAFEVYINDTAVGGNGRVGRTADEHEPEYDPKIVTFLPPSSQFDIFIHVSNFTYARGGMWYSTTFGLEDDVRHMDSMLLRKETALFGALLIMAMYHLSFYVFLRKDIRSLMFALGCLSFMLRILVTGERGILDVFPNLSFDMLIGLEYLSFVWAPLPFMVLVRLFFPADAKRLPIVLYGLCASVYTVLVLTAPVHWYTLFTNTFYIAMIAGIVSSVFFLVVAVLRRRESSLLYLISVGTFSATAIHDILYTSNVIVSPVEELSPFGLFLFLFAQSFVLGQRFSESFSKSEKLSEELLAMDKVKDEFLANTSHELRTPLNGMISISESLAQGVEGPLTEQQQRNLRMISRSGRRLNMLINDILDYSKMKHGDISIHPTSLSLEAVVVPVLEMHRYMTAGKPVRLEARDLAGIKVLADEDRLVQVLHNLIGNSVKFTDSGFVRVYANRRERDVEIVVEDTGIGIPEAHHSAIFNSFEQLDASVTRKQGGIGLGLSITRHIVELHGGTIRVESKEGSGSRFLFTLPRPKADDPPKASVSAAADRRDRRGSAAASEEASVPSVTGSSGSACVMVVDDDPINLQAVTNFLKMDRYTVITVTDSERVMDRLLRAERPVSLLIVDVMMPKLSGFQLAGMIRERWSELELPILMMTASHQLHNVVAGFEAGANDFLMKPFEPEEFRARVRTLVYLKLTAASIKETELAFLQAQIKPHFLYNTINTIATFCETDPGQAGELILNLGTYLQHSFDFHSLEDSCSLKQELELVEAYVKIEQARFGSRLTVLFDTDPELFDMLMPRLVMQPLVENAIRHGVLKRVKGGEVRVAVKGTGSACRIEIADDGVGMPQEQLASVMKQMEEKDASASFQPAVARAGVGIRNIHRRLVKHYGTGLEIRSVHGEGTVVSFSVGAGERR